MSIARIKIPGADFSGLGLPSVGGKYNPLLLSALQASWSAKDTDLITLASGKVTAWADRKSGLVLDDGGIAGKAPTYQAEGWAVTVGGNLYNMPCLSFDGAIAGNVLKNDSGPFGSTQAVFMVVERGAGQNASTVTNQRPMLVTGRADGSYFHHVGVRSIASDVDENLLSFSASGVNVTDAAGAFAVGQKSVVYALFKPNVFAAGINGETPTIHDASAETETPAVAEFGVGGQWSTAVSPTENANSVRRFKGKIAAVMPLNAEPDTTLRQLIEGHLAWEWGIAANLALGHPYRLTPPSA